jgi:hypothetical protein
MPTLGAKSAPKMRHPYFGKIWATRRYYLDVDFVTKRIIHAAVSFPTSCYSMMKSLAYI